MVSGRKEKIQIKKTVKQESGFPEFLLSLFNFRPDEASLHQNYLLPVMLQFLSPPKTVLPA
jgi:hypothetical protein